MTTTNYTWDEQNYLAEADGTNTINVVYTNEPEQHGDLVSSRISGTTSYHHFDALGSTRQLTSGAGSTTDTVIYDSWGNIVNRSGSTPARLLWIGVVGYYADPETGLTWVRARAYRPIIARWASADPLGLGEELNLYVYVRNTPSSATDPSGAACAPKECPERNTELVSRVPKKDTPADSKDPIRIKTQLERPGACGRYSWQIVWNLKDKAPATGAFILQHVKISRYAEDCDGNDVTETEFADGASSEYWEAFEVPAKKTQAKDADGYISKIHSCTIGTVDVVGDYGLVLKSINDYKKELPLNGAPLAKGLASSLKDPKIKTSAKKNHSLSIKWDCCTAETQ
jgi:RHS repeat-associated protein